jgi:serine hydrolase
VIAVLTVPGLWNSGPDHWQTLWEAEEPAWQRIHQADWETPLCDDWVSTIDGAVKATPGTVVLVAHSLGCTAVAHWAEIGRPIRGALLVAPSDVEAEAYPEGPRAFAPMPLHRLGFPSIVVASSNDPYVSLERARLFADAWGSTFVNVGPCGHINASSGVGAWPEGRALVNQLLAGRGSPT